MRLMDTKIAAIIEKGLQNKAGLIALFQEIQNKYVFIPKEAIAALAKGFNIPENHVYGIATFYFQYGVTIWPSSCVVNLVSFISSFKQQRSCGNCIPCRIGTKRIRDILESIMTGKASLHDLDSLKSLAETMKNTSLCGFGQGAPDFIVTSLKYFEDIYLAHVEKKQCPAHVCHALIRFEINKESCTSCGLCQQICPRSAIEGNKKKGFKIVQKICNQCNQCYHTCPVKAIYKEDRYPSEGT